MALTGKLADNASSHFCFCYGRAAQVRKRGCRLGFSLTFPHSVRLKPNLRQSCRAKSLTFLISRSLSTSAIRISPFSPQSAGNACALRNKNGSTETTSKTLSIATSHQPTLAPLCKGGRRSGGPSRGFVALSHRSRGLFSTVVKGGLGGRLTRSWGSQSILRPTKYE